MLTFISHLGLAPEDKLVGFSKHILAILDSSFFNGSIVITVVKWDYLMHLMLEVETLSINWLHWFLSLLAKNIVDIYELIIFVLWKLRNQTISLNFWKSLIHSLWALGVILREWMVNEVVFLKQITFEEVLLLRDSLLVLYHVDTCEVANIGNRWQIFFQLVGIN